MSLTQHLAEVRQAEIERQDRRNQAVAAIKHGLPAGPPVQFVWHAACQHASGVHSDDPLVALIARGVGISADALADAIGAAVRDGLAEVVAQPTLRREPGVVSGGRLFENAVTFDPGLGRVEIGAWHLARLARLIGTGDTYDQALDGLVAAAGAPLG